MIIDILIPSCKNEKEIIPIINSIREHSGNNYRNILFSCADGCAAKNRNIVLDKTDAEVVVMIDDDISGFFNGWIELLTEPFNNNEAMLISANLIRRDGSIAIMCSDRTDRQTRKLRRRRRGRNRMILVPHGEVPSARIAFRNDGTRFDENYDGSGREDIDFCWQLKHKYPDFKVYIMRECRMVHDNEQKNNNYHIKNMRYFRDKWKMEG